MVTFLCTVSLHKGDLRLSGPPSGQGTCSGTKIGDKRIPADLMVDPLSTVPTTLRDILRHNISSPEMAVGQKTCLCLSLPVLSDLTLFVPSLGIDAATGLNPGHTTLQFAMNLKKDLLNRSPLCANHSQTVNKIFNSKKPELKTCRNRFPTT
ncbi:hypothetical protein PoB_001473700 [Plakobranchus ocellatus]|uniref:Uncharacterized protein n=1 Tax=Plakobranchus ocellatus TaxID=259542 RepID=A0AAV3YZ27_9GAST|nr:hypothetical protein PoB_001473700 [Plakobranchus ocellatus]